MNRLPKLLSLLCLALPALSLIQACNADKKTAVVYPEPLPGDSAVSFLPGIVCSAGDSIDFNATFSPDGKAFYFTRSQHRKWDIYVSRFENGRWRKAVTAGVGADDHYSDADPMFGPDGFLYFISDRPKDVYDSLRDFDIWYVKPTADGGWSAPEHVEGVNSDSTEYYVSFAGDGTMYFASSRPGGYGMEDIYRSPRINGRYTTPENLGPQINSTYSDHDPCLPANERFIIYTSVDRPDGLGEGDLYMAIKGSDGRWQNGVSMGPRFNTPTYEYCSYLTADQRYFFFSSRRDVKWARAEALPAELAKLLQ